MDLKEYNQADFDWELDHWWISTRYKYLNNFVRDKFGQQGTFSVIETGSGSAPNLKLLRKNFKNIIQSVAYDINYKKNISHADIDYINHIDDQNNKYDLIVAMDVLEHIDSDLLALKEWTSRLLKDGGYIFCTVPAHKFLWSSHDVFLEHFRRYNEIELIELFEKAELKVLSNGFMFSALVPVAYILRKLRSKNNKTTLSKNGFLINSILRLVFAVEFLLSFLIRIPFGTSLYICAQKSVHN